LIARGRLLFSFLALGSTLTACGRHSSLPAPNVAGGSVEAPRIVPGALEARPLLGDLPSRASRLGAGPLAIVASGMMTEGERLGAFVEVPKDACLLAYGRASPSLEDIDLAAFAEEGNPVAVDETSDPRPTLLLCPPHPDRVYVAAHAAAGEGLCVIGAQLVPRERAAEVGRAVGAHGSTPRTPEVWPGLEDQVRTHRRAIGGAWDEQRRVAVAADARAVSAVAFNVEEGGCSDALVVPDEDVAIVDVDVLDAEGRIVARAKESGTVRSVTLCSPLAIAGSLQVRPHVGRGTVAVVVAKAKTDTARELLTKPEVVWAAPGQPLDATKAQRNAALTKAGYGAATSSSTGQLLLGRRSTVTVDTAGGGCTRIDVVAGTPLALVDAAVWDDAGALLASGDGIDGTTVFACGKGKARVDLGTRGRPGPYALLARPEKWKEAAFTAHPLAAGRMLGRAASGPGAVHEGTAGAVRHAVLEPAKRHVHDANVRAGACLRVSAGAEGEGTGLELRLFDAVSGEELDRSHGQTAASVRACAAQSAARSVRIEARSTAGKLDVVFGERIVP
jgi:hypothetical protein